MSDPEKIDVILRNKDMRAEAKVIFDELYAGEVIPFMDKYDDFVNARSAKSRGQAFEAIFEHHLLKGSKLELNLLESQMDELRALAPSQPGPIASDSPLVKKLADAADQVKVSMAGTLTGQLRGSRHYERAQELLAQAAKRRPSLSDTVRGFAARVMSSSSPKLDRSPPSSGSSSSSSSSNPISSSISSLASDAHRASAVGSSGASSSSGPRSIASANFDDYFNMDAVLASPGATRDLRAYLRRGFESLPPGLNTENLDFLESYVDFAAEADPAAKKMLLSAMIDKFVQQGSPSEINLMVGGLRKRVVEASRAWIGQADAAMPQTLVDDLATARRQIATLLQDKGNALDLLRKELFPQGGPTAT